MDEKMEFSVILVCLGEHYFEYLMTDF